jgi:hypothetical protein
MNNLGKWCKTWGFFKILKQILKNAVINIPNDMWFERKVTILALIRKWNIVFTKVCVKFLNLNLEAFNYRYNISFIDPPLGGFGEILPSVMIFPSGQSASGNIITSGNISPNPHRSRSINDKYSPRRSRGEYSPIITEPVANNCFSIFKQPFCVFWDWIYFNFAYFFLVTSTKRLAAILKISVLLYSPVGEYKLNASNLTNQLVGFVIFACAKILNYDIKMFHFAIAFEGD